MQPNVFEPPTASSIARSKVWDAAALCRRFFPVAVCVPQHEAHVLTALQHILQDLQFLCVAYSAVKVVAFAVE